MLLIYLARLWNPGGGGGGGGGEGGRISLFKSLDHYFFCPGSLLFILDLYFSSWISTFCPGSLLFRPGSLLFVLDLYFFELNL